MEEVGVVFDVATHMHTHTNTRALSPTHSFIDLLHLSLSSIQLFHMREEHEQR